jgi:acetoin utilization deacetylase AcuC-like enzyme
VLEGGYDTDRLGELAVSHMRGLVEASEELDEGGEDG